MMKNDAADKGPLGGLVKKILDKISKDENSEAIGIAWEKAIGGKFAEFTKLASFKKGKLTVLVSDSGRLYELTLRKEDIIKDVNERIKGKKIKDIRFKIGNIK